MSKFVRLLFLDEASADFVGQIWPDKRTRGAGVGIYLWYHWDSCLIHAMSCHDENSRLPIRRREEKRREEKRREEKRREEKRTEQNRTEQNRTEQNRTEQNRTEQNRTEQNRREEKRREEKRKDDKQNAKPSITEHTACTLMGTRS